MIYSVEMELHVSTSPYAVLEGWQCGRHLQKQFKASSPGCRKVSVMTAV
jgi:hypothetical protein